MLHAESEKRMKFKNAESKLKDYINGTMTYQETLRQNESKVLSKNISHDIKAGKYQFPELGEMEIKKSTLMRKAKKKRPATGTGRRYTSNKRPRSGAYGRSRPQTGRRRRPQTGMVKFKSGGTTARTRGS